MQKIDREQTRAVTKLTYPCPKRQIFDSSKLKVFTDNNSKLDENGRKFSEKIENTVGNGQIALYKFLLFAHGFQKTCTEDR